ncbi:MAG: hypothetical protein ABIE70_10630 [bacterium]
MLRSLVVSLIIVVLVSFSAARAQDYLVDAECAVWDSLHNRYLVSCFSTADIVAIDTVGNQTMFKNLVGRVLSNCIGGNTFYVSRGTSVVGYDLDSANLVLSVAIPGSKQLDGMATDTSGFLYVADYVFDQSHPDRIYKIRLSDGNVSTFVSSGLAISPQDIIFDAAHNRLLVACYSANSPIQAVSLEDSSVTDLVVTPMGFLDGIAQDLLGNYYISRYGEGVFRYDSTFTNPPELVSTGHDGNANICYNHRDHILVVPEFTGDTVVFVQMGLPKVAHTCLSDATYGDGDGVMEPEETVELFVSVFNTHFLPLTDISVDLTGISDGLIPIQTHVDLGTAAARSYMYNTTEPLTFQIPAGYEGQMDSFHIEINGTSDYGTKIVDTVLFLGTGEICILIVDDSPRPSVAPYYQNDLLTTDYTYELWSSLYSGAPDAADLLKYDIVMWITGNYHEDALSAEEIAALTGFLDGGGSLMLSGQGLAEQLQVADPDFLGNYLRSEYLRTVSYPFLVGEAGGQVFGVADTVYLSGAANNQTHLDRIQAVNGGVAEFKFYNDVDWGAVSCDGEYRSLFLAFGYEGIRASGTNYTDRIDIMEKILDFLDWFNPYHCCEVPGDIDESGTGPNIADLVYLVNYMFNGGPQPICMQTTDIDGNGDGPNIADLVYLVNYMFNGGPEPAACD